MQHGTVVNDKDSEGTGLNVSLGVHHLFCSLKKPINVRHIIKVIKMGQRREVALKIYLSCEVIFIPEALKCGEK